MKSVVSVCSIKEKESVIESVKRSMKLADWQEFIPENADISLKPNLGFDLFYPGSTTSPLVVEAVIQTIYDRVSKIYIVESDQVLVDIEKGYKNMKIDRIVNKYEKVEWVNMSKTKWVNINIEDSKIFKTLPVPEILTKTKLITIPVLKTHDKTVITGAIKNQWGCIDKLRHQYHLVLNDALEDISKVFKPIFAVMDGTIGLEGNAPKSGIPRVCDVVLASNDFVAMDITAAKLMGFNPYKIKHIVQCANAMNTSFDNIIVNGDFENLPNFNFKPAKHNLVSIFELVLRKSVFKKLFFDTFVFNICCFLSRIYYYLWYFFKGRKAAQYIVNHTRYGEQFK